MKITTSGSLGNVGKPLVEALVAAGHDVTVITSSADRQEAIRSLGATAAVGEVSDADFLAQAFAGADAVYTMTPPAMGGRDIVENIARTGQAYARAIREAGVQRVVMLSSIGAHAPEGTGPVGGVHRVEQLFRQLSGVHVTILRAGIFFNNFFRDIPVIRNSGILSNNYSGDDRLVLAHPEDIAAAIAAELERSGTGIEIRYVASDIATGNEIARVLGTAIGRPELSWVTFPDDQLQQGMIAAGLPPELAGLLTEMGQAIRSGVITEDFFATGANAAGRIRLDRFAEQFRDAYARA